MVLVNKLDELGRPAWIALVILGFWPGGLGLVILAFILGSGRMGCWTSPRRRTVAAPQGRWQSKMERMQEKMDRLRAKMDARGAAAVVGARHRAASALRRLSHQRCAGSKRSTRDQGILERLRFAKDRAEFDQFMAERRNSPHDAGPQPQPQI